MVRTTPPSPHPVLDELRTSLDLVLAALAQQSADVSLTLTPVRVPARRGPEHAYRIEGPEGVTVRVRFGVDAVGDGTADVCVEIEEGLTCHFAYDPTGADGKANRNRLGREVTTVLYREIQSRLGQASPEVEAPTESSVPTLTLDREGSIQYLNAAARNLLDCADEDAVESNFFAHVHGRNLRRVMRDLARMVRGNQQRARWLLRVRTGADRRRWFRANAQNRLTTQETIQLRLYPLGGRQRDAHEEAPP